MFGKLTGLGDGGAVKKNIAMFTQKQRFLSIDMKTKVFGCHFRVNFGLSYQNKSYLEC